MVRAFVVGWPISHSRSPIIHRYWLSLYGIHGDYERVPCEPGELERFLRSMEQEGFVGGNITLPHKEAAFLLADHLSLEARRLKAVNTVWLDGDRLSATNTDGYGFMANLDEQAPTWSSPSRLKRGALVLGAGGAARAVVGGLLDRGFSTVLIANRTLSRAQELAEEFGPRCKSVPLENPNEEAREASLIVNTTSLGMAGTSNGSALPVSLEGFSADTIVHDIVYTPLHTPLLVDAKERDMPIVDGLGMLLHQAVPGFERWFGVRPEVTTELRNRVLANLRESP